MIQQTAISAETIGYVMQQHAVFGLHGHFDNETLRKSFYVLCGILVEEQRSKMDYEEMFYHWFKLHFYHIITDVVYFFKPLYVLTIIHISSRPVLIILTHREKWESLEEEPRSAGKRQQQLNREMRKYYYPFQKERES
jgi:hypothetical protein